MIRPLDRNPFSLTPFYQQIHQLTLEKGGYHNAHLHLDRSFTYDDVRQLLLPPRVGAASHLSLPSKHNLISEIHSSKLYDSENLYARTSLILEEMHQAGTTGADTLVDVSTDGLGMRALEVFLSLKEDFRGRLDLRVGAYNPLGFSVDPKNSERLVRLASEIADFVAFLPERDDHSRTPDAIGFRRSLQIAIEIGAESRKPTHIHLDQMNLPQERGTEQLLSVLEQENLSNQPPQIWAIHVISPSTYDEKRFEELLDRFQSSNLGLIVCPSAAISMRIVRTVLSPMGNSLARVLNFASRGIPVRVGSDNIHDITSPGGTPDLLFEVGVLSHALRFFDVEILSSFLAGRNLTSDQIETIETHLERDTEECQKIATALDFESEMVGRG